MFISVSSKAQIRPRAEPPTACSICTLFLAPSIKQLHYSLMFQKTWDQSECGICSCVGFMSVILLVLLVCWSTTALYSRNSNVSLCYISGSVALLMCWLYVSNTLNLHWCAGPLLPCVLGTQSFAVLYLRECGSAHVLVILIGVLGLCSRTRSFTMTIILVSVAHAHVLALCQ